MPPEEKEPFQDLSLCDGHMLPNQYTASFNDQEFRGHSVAGLYERSSESEMHPADEHDGGTWAQENRLARVQRSSPENRTRGRHLYPMPCTPASSGTRQPGSAAAIRSS